MRTNDVNVEQFKSIQEVYAFVESNAIQFERNWDLTELFMKYRSQATEDSEKQKAQWEVEFSYFEFKGAKIFSFAQSTGENVGELSLYPNLDEFQLEGFAYLRQRLTETKNPLLLARYNHLLWHSPKGIRNKGFALAAIEAYTNSIREFYNLIEKEDKKRNQFYIGRTFETLIGLCDEIKSGLDDLKTLTKFLLFEATHLRFYAKHGIVDDMLNYPGLFKKGDFENVLPIFRKEIEENLNQSADSLLVSYHIPTAIKVAIKTGADVKYWHNETGFAYLQFANEETLQERYWIKLDHYAKAIHSFALAGNKKDKAATERMYAELKPKVTLPTHYIEFNKESQKALQETQEDIKNHASEILKNPPEKVYNWLSMGMFFPKYQNILKISKDSPADFTRFTSTPVYFDKNKNISKYNEGTEDQREFYKIYQQQIAFVALPYLHYIIVSGIKSGHLTFESFITYLAKSTWIGKTVIKTDLGGEPEEINWITLLSPAIYEFFVQVQAWGNTKYYKPSFVLCIDSLALKMEGLFRNFCERLDISVSVGRNKAMQEAYMHNLLEHETIKKYFNEDDLLLFNYLFSSDNGMNLRNNVAHCFYNIKEYNHDKMLLLLAALLRVGKYDIKKNDT